jgi:hypothetical protein
MVLMRADILIPVAVLALIGTVHRRIAQKGTFFLLLSNLPVTILHEAAHYSVALLLGGQPSGFSLWPQRVKGGWRLGSVNARVTVISAAPTALAPVAWLFVAGVLMIKRTALAGGSLPVLCGVYLAAYICSASSVPSWQDIKVAVTHPVSFLLWSSLLFAADFVIG